MKQLIDKFYTAFTNLDAEAMASCYHKDITFHDPAFGELKGKQAGNMWRMLCASQKDKNMTVTFKNVIADNNQGSAHWEAYYTFSKTGRPVHNIIAAQFEFKDELIIKHTDRFNLHRWASQAMGLSGKLIGWTGFFQKKLQTQTHRLLHKFESKL